MDFTKFQSSIILRFNNDKRVSNIIAKALKGRKNLAMGEAHRKYMIKLNGSPERAESIIFNK
jgi:hypothetical protein